MKVTIGTQEPGPIDILSRTTKPSRNSQQPTLWTLKFVELPRVGLIQQPQVHGYQFVGVVAVGYV
jgi:hypothetical protein